MDVGYLLVPSHLAAKFMKLSHNSLSKKVNPLNVSKKAASETYVNKPEFSIICAWGVV